MPHETADRTSATSPGRTAGRSTPLGVTSGAACGGASARRGTIERQDAVAEVFLEQALDRLSERAAPRRG
jgi:hypothetical protein